MLLRYNATGASRVIAPFRSAGFFLRESLCLSPHVSSAALLLLPRRVRPRSLASLTRAMSKTGEGGSASSYRTRNALTPQINARLSSRLHSETRPRFPRPRPITQSTEAYVLNSRGNIALTSVAVFPLFDKSSSAESASTFRWISPALGPRRSCLHAISGDPKPSAKVAAFDLDGCLIQGTFPKKGAPPKFEWWRPIVPKKLKQVHDEG